MFVYFEILALVCLVVFVASKLKDAKVASNVIFYMSAIFLICLAGFRSNFIGTDTNNYISMFISYNNFKESIFKMETSIEIGYLFLQQIASLFSDNYWSILTTIAVVSIVPIYYIIKELSYNTTLSIFIYFTLGIYLLFFNAGRQGIAVSIASVGIIYILERKLLWFLVCIFIASLFHRTALIMIPFYFILVLPYSTRNLILFTIIGFFSFYFLSTILGFLSPEVESRYAIYEDRGATGGFLLATFFILVSILLIVLRPQVSEEKLYVFDVYLNLTVFTSIVYLVVILTGSDVNFIRLTNYFAIGFVLIWPIVFEDVKLFKLPSTRFLVIAVHLAYLTIYLGKMSNLIPYTLNKFFL